MSNGAYYGGYGSYGAFIFNLSAGLSQSHLGNCCKQVKKGDVVTANRREWEGSNTFVIDDNCCSASKEVSRMFSMTRRKTRVTK